MKSERARTEKLYEVQLDGYYGRPIYVTGSSVDDVVKAVQKMDYPPILSCSDLRIANGGGLYAGGHSTDNPVLVHFEKKEEPQFSPGQVIPH